VLVLARLFGHGDDDHPLWLLAVRVDVLFVLAAVLVASAVALARLRRHDLARLRTPILVAALVTLAAAALRVYATGNLLDQGGIPYSRLLVGYRGNFAAAQAYALVYALAGRSIEHAIFLDRLAGIATVPLVFVLARSLVPRSLAFPALAAGLLAVSPLHAILSASDALSGFSAFVCALGWACLARGRATWTVAGLLALSLLTQVRYEDALLVVPAVIFLAVRGRRTAAGLAIVAGLVFVPAQLLAGSSFQPHPRAASLAGLLDPVVGLPLLAAGAVLVVLARRPWLLVAALAPFACVLALAAGTAEIPFDAARIVANLVVPLVVAAAYGFARLARLGPAGRLAAAAVAVFAASRPLVHQGELRARYLEIAENDAFASLLASVPDDVEAVVVPDDDVMRGAEHATVEQLGKYRAIRRALPRRGPPLVGLTAFLEHPPGWCPPGHCLFFRGLPCVADTVNRPARAQCDALAERDPMTPVAAVHARGAPYLACIARSGNDRRRSCDPAVQDVDFALLRIR
jgi:hypothetical protein